MGDKDLLEKSGDTALSELSDLWLKEAANWARMELE